MTSNQYRLSPRPTWLDSLLFFALMSGPPKLRDRDPMASLTGTVDIVVAMHIAVWVCGGLWVLARLYPAALQRRGAPNVNVAQWIGALFITALTLSVVNSPGILLTVFTLGQFAVMLAFLWLFTSRYGPRTCLEHLFVCVSLLALTTVALVILAPNVVIDDADFVAGVTRIRGDLIADTGSIAVLGLVFCLSSLPALRGPIFWGALSLFGGLLAASRTRSALVAFVGFLAIGFVYGRGLRVRKLVVPMAAVGIGVLLLDAASSTVNYLVRDRETVENLSDRIPLWQHLTTVVMRESPLTGLGYYAASRVVAPQYNPRLGNAHSVFFEVLVGGGLLGAGLYLLLCVVLARFALQLLRVASGQPEAMAATGLLFITVTMGLTTPAALQPGPLGFAFWSLTAVLPALLRESAPARILSEQRLRWRSPRPREEARVRVGSSDALTLNQTLNNSNQQ